MSPKVRWGTFEKGLHSETRDEHKQLRSSIHATATTGTMEQTRIHFISRLGKLNSFIVGTARLSSLPNQHIKTLYYGLTFPRETQRHVYSLTEHRALTDQRKGSLEVQLNDPVRSLL